MEKSRSLFGDRWAQCRLACVSGGIKSVTEKCNDTPELFDASKPMCRRARYARLRAGQPAWWEKHLQQAKTDLDMSFGLLILLTWGSPNCLASLTGVIGPALEGLPSPVWLKLWKALGRQIDISRIEAGENAGSVELTSPPVHPSERMIAAFGERSDVTVASSLYKRFLENYSGSDFAVLEFAQEQAIRHLLMPDEDKPPHLAMIERSYARGVMPAYDLARVAREDPMVRGISADVAERIASYPDRYPMEIVGFAEVFCKEVVSASIVPVGTIAVRDRWFAT